MATRSARGPYILFFFALLGTALSLLLLRHDVALRSGAQIGPSFCNINATFNCDAVARSEWSQLLGIPLSSWGLFYFVSLALFSLLASDARRVPPQVFSDASFVCALFGACFSLYLFSVSYFFIGALCLYCIGVYLLNFTVFVFTCWGETDKSFMARLGDGGLLMMRALRLPFQFSQTSSVPTVARCFVILLLLVGTSAVLLPEYLQSRTIKSFVPTHLELGKDAVAQWQETEPQQVEVNLEPGVSLDYAQGQMFAAVRIVEFSDFQCPACKRFFFVLEQVAKEFGDKVHIVQKNYPLDKSCNPTIEHELHRHACYAAYFARCAGEQGKYWEGAKYLFELESLHGSEGDERVRSDIDQGAKVLGLDGEAFTQCMNSQRYAEKIQDDIRQGNELGLQGTPSVWINGRKVEDLQEDSLRKIIKYILREP